MNTRSRLPKSLGILIVSLVATVCAASLISVRGESHKTFTFGSAAFGVAPGQFARLSASNVFGDATMHVDFVVIDAAAGTINTIVPQDVPPGGRQRMGTPALSTTDTRLSPIRPRGGPASRRE